MRLGAILGLAAVLILPGIVMAQPIGGLYVAGGVGANFMQTEKYKANVRLNPIGIFPGQTFSDTERFHFNTGFVGVGSIGYGFGNGMRVEVEGDYRKNDVRHFSRSEEKFGGMANVLFDLDVGSSYVYPYIGGGAGYMRVNRIFSDQQTGSFAYQGIAGASFPIAWVPGLAATFEYRFMGLEGERQDRNAPGFPGGTITTTYNNDANHSLLAGLRYAFNTAPPPVQAATATPVPAVVPARTYLVFFDWDRADLTDRARQIIAEAAQNSTRVQTTRIEVQGNADRSGTPAYNQTLSLHRAQTVAAELVRHGVPQNQIDIEAFGDTRPLVPTAAGVREPQNRRVAIILR